MRVWDAGLRNGGGSLSIAILLMEAAATLPASPKIMIFATDIDDRALEQARAGRYTKAQLDSFHSVALSDGSSARANVTAFRLRSGRYAYSRFITCSAIRPSPSWT